DEGLVGLHGGAGPSSEPQDYSALVAQALAKLAEEKRPQPVAAVAAKAFGAVERAAEEQRQRAIRQLRKRLLELEAGALESLVGVMLAEMGYRDVRIAKRHKEGALLLTSRRMGLTEVRFAVRVIKGGREVRREEIADLRKDMASHGAQMGVVVSPADPTREARNEASNAQAPLVTLLCADALADQLAERGVGVATRTVKYVDFDEASFRAALRQRAPAEGEAEAQPKKAGPTAEERRERRERERKEWRERREKAREERRRQRQEAEAAAAGAAASGEVAGAPAEQGETAAATGEPSVPQVEHGVEGGEARGAQAAFPAGQGEAGVEGGEARGAQAAVPADQGEAPAEGREPRGTQAAVPAEKGETPVEGGEVRGAQAAATAEQAEAPVAGGDPRGAQAAAAQAERAVAPTATGEPGAALEKGATPPPASAASPAEVASTGAESTESSGNVASAEGDRSTVEPSAPAGAEEVERRSNASGDDS
ncbi:MAG TPA: restriction endonuclease, partial [Vulgatibacter sp.]